jgi:hypothetical protein
MLPSAVDSIDTLVNEHQSSIYTIQPGSPARARRAAWKLVGQTWLARLHRAWNAFDSRFNRYG